MPFEKGNTLSPGRKGYELEKEQLDIMKELVSKDLALVKKIYDGKAEESDFKKLSALQIRVSKYLDKLHASKTELKADIDARIEVDPITKQKTEEALDKL